MSKEDYDTVIRTEIFANNGVMTYRLFSRKLGIPVSEAKEYLLKFKESTKEPIHATYIISGLQKVDLEGPVTISNPLTNGYQPSQRIESLRVKSENKVTQSLQKIIKIIPEEELESFKSQLETVDSVHIYSIAKSNSCDLTGLTNAEQELRSLELNNESTIADLKAYGVITNPYVDDDLILLPKSISKPAKQKSAYQPARRAETVPTKLTESSKPETKPSPVSRKPSTTTSTSLVSDARKSKSSSKAKNQPTLSQSFFGAGPKTSKPKKSEPFKSAKETEKPAPPKDDQDKKESIKSEPKEKDQDKQVSDHQIKKPVSEPKKDSIERKKEEEMSEGLKNMFSDSEDDAMKEDEESEKDIDEEMPDAPIEVDDTPFNTKQESEEKQLDAEDVSKNKIEENPAPAPSRGRKKKRVLKRINTVDSLGYLVTKTEEVFESCSESDGESQDQKKETKISKSTVLPPIPAFVPKSKDKRSKAKTKQGSLMSFFK